MRRLMNADRKKKGNDLENNVNVFEGHSLSAKSLALIVTNSSNADPDGKSETFKPQRRKDANKPHRQPDSISILFGSLRSDRFHFDRLSRNATHHVKRRDVFRCHAD